MNQSIHVGKTINTCPFRPWIIDSKICDKCGGLKDDHPKVNMLNDLLPYKEKLWHVLIAKGGIASYYGNLDKVPTLELRHHFGFPLFSTPEEFFLTEGTKRQFMAKYPMRSSFCSPLYEMMSVPVSGSVNEFRGTAPEEVIEVVQGNLICQCGRYGTDEWDQESVVLHNINISQLLWLAFRSEQAM